MTDSEFDQSAADCGHNDLKYGEMDVTEPGVVYENWYCLSCGATVVNVYTPSHAIVMPREADETEQHEIEAVVE